MLCCAVPGLGSSSSRCRCLAGKQEDRKPACQYEPIRLESTEKVPPATQFAFPNPAAISAPTSDPGDFWRRSGNQRVIGQVRRSTPTKSFNFDPFFVELWLDPCEAAECIIRFLLACILGSLYRQAALREEGGSKAESKGGRGRKMISRLHKYCNRWTQSAPTNRVFGGGWG